MGRYLRRIFQGILTLFVMASACFFLLEAFPGSPLSDETPLNPVVKAQIESHYGLNLSPVEKYFRFLGNLVRGDLGYSMHFPGQTVSGLIAERIGMTVILGFAALMFAMGSGFCFAFVSLFFRWDSIFQIITLMLISLPIIPLGPFLIWLFGFYLNILPVALLESPQSYILPVLVMASKPAGSIARILRASLQEVLQEDYIRVGRAFGYSETALIMKAGLRNSLLPFLTYLGPLLATLLTGSFLVEIMFAIQGLGLQYVDGLINRDYPVVIGLTLVYGLILVSAQIVLDFIAEILDPRMRTR